MSRIATTLLLAACALEGCAPVPAGDAGALTIRPMQADIAILDFDSVRCDARFVLRNEGPEPLRIAAAEVIVRLDGRLASARAARPPGEIAPGDDALFDVVGAAALDAPSPLGTPTRRVEIEVALRSEEPDAWYRASALVEVPRVGRPHVVCAGIRRLRVTPLVADVAVPFTATNPGPVPLQVRAQKIALRLGDVSLPPPAEILTFELLPGERATRTLRFAVRLTGRNADLHGPLTDPNARTSWTGRFGAYFDSPLAPIEWVIVSP